MYAKEYIRTFSTDQTCIMARHRHWNVPEVHAWNYQVRNILNTGTCMPVE